MPNVKPTEISAVHLHEHLRDLQSELALARELGLDDNATYMAALERAVTVTSAAYVGAAVTEIASLRAALNGPQRG